jgi:putative hydrolase of the HAD superfamily
MSALNLHYIRCLLIDLDDTLYPYTNGIWEMIRKRINSFMIEEMDFPAGEVPALRHRLWQQYGTTLRGLQAEYTVDMNAYLTYVHDIPLNKFLGPDQALAQMLRILPQRKIIFTNAPEAHARRVMDLLGVTDLFEMIVDIYAVTPHCKPEPEAFHKALALIGDSPEQCLLIDDSPGNLDTARMLGMGTVSVGLHQHDGSPHIEHICELQDLIDM